MTERQNMLHPDSLRTFLFDLDGTLADTAPDIAHALNRVLGEEGEAPLPLAAIRPIVSQGGRAMVEYAFGIDSKSRGFDSLLRRFLDIYRDNVANRTCLFPGMEAVLGAIEARGINWGVVTNKAQWLTHPLMDGLGLTARAACIVSGDTTANRKPHPEPLLFACGQLRSTPAQCLYVGDSSKDIQAGRQAGMCTVVALFGYIALDDDPTLWGADGAIVAPTDLLEWLAEIA